MEGLPPTRPDQWSDLAGHRAVSADAPTHRYGHPDPRPLGHTDRNAHIAATDCDADSNIYAVATNSHTDGDRYLADTNSHTDCDACGRSQAVFAACLE